MHHLHDPPSDALLRFAHSCSFAALCRRPSLRSARGCATPWLRHAEASPPVFSTRSARGCATPWLRHAEASPPVFSSLSSDWLF